MSPCSIDIWKSHESPLWTGANRLFGSQVISDVWNRARSPRDLGWCHLVQAKVWESVWPD